MQSRLTLFGRHIDHGGYKLGKQACINWLWPQFHGLLTLLKYIKFSWLDTSVHYHTTWVDYIWSSHWSWRVQAWQAGICQLTLTSVSWSTDFVKVHQVFMIRYICSLSYNLGWQYLVLTLIMEGTSLAGRHVSTDFDLSFMVYWSTSFNVHTLIMEIELHACVTWPWPHFHGLLT